MYIKFWTWRVQFLQIVTCCYCIFYYVSSNSSITNLSPCFCWFHSNLWSRLTVVSHEAKSSKWMEWIGTSNPENQRLQILWQPTARAIRTTKRSLSTLFTSYSGISTFVYCIHISKITKFIATVVLMQPSSHQNFLLGYSHFFKPGVRWPKASVHLVFEIAFVCNVAGMCVCLPPRL